MILIQMAAALIDAPCHKLSVRGPGSVVAPLSRLQVNVCVCVSVFSCSMYAMFQSFSAGVVYAFLEPIGCGVHNDLFNWICDFYKPGYIVYML